MGNLYKVLFKQTSREEAVCDTCGGDQYVVNLKKTWCYFV
jgi:hypothetical protein